MKAWLKCSLEPGMFPNEYAVSITTLADGDVSLFAPDFKVDRDRQLVCVEVFDCNEADALVRLPSPPFEIACQNVRVPQDSLVAQQADEGNKSE